MFVGWYLGLIGLFVGIIYCQDNSPSAIDNDSEQEPDVNVILSVDTRPKSSSDIQNSIPEPFSCHECTNCNRKSDLTTRVCESDINMCYTIHRRIKNVDRIIRRGCSTSRGYCAVFDDDQSYPFDSITCCTSHKCNQAIQFKPLLFLFILNLFIIMIII